MEAAGAAQERHPLRLAGLIVAGVVLVVGLAAVVLFLWLGSYAPLAALGDGTFAPGPGLGADVRPVTGSGGKTVFLPTYRKGRPFDTAFTVHNDGRFAVTVTGLGSTASSPELAPQELLTTDSSTASTDPARLQPFEKLRLDPGDSAILVVRWRLDCPAGDKSEVFADRVPLRYDYLSLFTRTERVRLPFAVTLRCAGGPPETP
jgi:hypothetical protein